jgi:DNA-binding response OmpR family regulator
MGRRTVLIVEDHDSTRIVLERAFGRRQWETRAVATVADALRFLDPPPGCLILDLNLPDTNGELLLETIQAERIPVKLIAVTTGVTDPIRLRRVAELRPALLIMKPIDWEILVRYCSKELETGE